MRINRKLVWGIGVTIALAVAAILLSPRAAFNQILPSPIVGTWNFQGTIPGTGEATFLAVMTFNAGGTTVEFDTGGTNSSASPGESVTLGKWKQTGLLTFAFQQENVTYDGSGNLNFIAIANEQVTLDPTLQTLTGSGTATFFTCSISVCPGTQVGDPVQIQFTGKRF